tara:strand:+ start:27737 stop:28651 length:915 start_codon:yes stop_codon:yes gene_type:complete
MQCIYALTQSQNDTLEKQEKFLRVSIENMYSLYLVSLNLLMEVHAMAEDQIKRSSKKYLSNASDGYPDKNKFVGNAVLLQLVGNSSLTDELKRRKLNNWYLNEEYVRIIYREITASESYQKYMSQANRSYQEDKDLIVDLFRNVIAPNEKVYDHFEDDRLTWVDDIPIVNTFILKKLKKINKEHSNSYFLPKLVKDEEDLEFAQKLLMKTLLNNEKLVKEIEGKTPNWDKDRIADVDAILLKMAICELLNFPSIPERVTINEYLEIAKEYSTPKSSIFINGILDNLIKEYSLEGKLKKVGRGLL